MNTNPKYRRPLNEEQFEVLHLLYRFRFVTTELVAQYQQKPKASAVYSRLRVLADQGFIGRRYEKSYKLLGKPASYHILPKGIQLLKEDVETDQKVLQAMYRDRTASEAFIDRNITLFRINNILVSAYRELVDLFTKNELSKFDYFPDKLPDAYISLKTSKGSRTKHYLLELFSAPVPHFAVTNRIKELIEHAESGAWNENLGKPPVILMVCETVKQQKVLQPRIARLEEVEDSESQIYITNQKSLFETDDLDVWQSVVDPISLNNLDYL